MIFLGGKKQSGFTIVELLIVIVVIAILAAITIVAYNGIQARAQESSVQSDLRQNHVQLRLYRADNGGVYPRNTAELNSADLYASDAAYFTENKANFYYCTTSDFTQYAIVAQSKSGKAFVYNSLTGLEEFTQTNLWRSDTANWAKTCEAAGDNLSGSMTGMVRGNWSGWVQR